MIIFAIEKSYKMKKLFLLLVVAISLYSCGSDKKKENASEIDAIVTDKYNVVLEAIYEKDDSIVVFYQKDKFFQYEKPTSLKIKGSPLMQRLTINLPEGIAIENLSITTSTNKSQDFITIKSLSVLDDKTVVVDGSNGKYSESFLTDPSFSWDLKNSRYNLNHKNEYPPSIVGNANLSALLTK